MKHMQLREDKKIEGIVVNLRVYITFSIQLWEMDPVGVQVQLMPDYLLLFLVFFS